MVTGEEMLDLVDRSHPPATDLTDDPELAQEDIPHAIRLCVDHGERLSGPVALVTICPPFGVSRRGLGPQIRRP